MSKHSKAWTKKKQALIQKEQEFKQELESVSNLFEGRAKMILIISLSTGGLFLILFTIYRIFFKAKPEPKAATQKIKNTKRTVVRTLITERIMSAILAYAGQQLNQIVKGKTKK